MKKREIWLDYSYEDDINFPIHGYYLKIKPFVLYMPTFYIALLHQGFEQVYIFFHVLLIVFLNFHLGRNFYMKKSRYPMLSPYLLYIFLPIY